MVALLRVMTDAARAAGRVLRRDFTELEHLQSSPQGRRRFALAADRRSEDIIYEHLLAARPDFSFVMEERGIVEGKDTEHRWIVDPLDGTRNFLRAVPHCAISIALEHCGAVIAGVIHDPIHGDVYQANQGGGAFFNGKKIRVSERSDEMVFATGRLHPNYTAALFAFMRATGARRRQLGSVALELAWTASGRLDGYCTQGAHSWDVAAGIILVREAGGLVSDYRGGDAMIARSELIASAPGWHDAMRRIFTGAKG